MYLEHKPEGESQVDVSVDEAFLEKVKADIRENYEFGLFSILPSLYPDLEVALERAIDIGIPKKVAREFSERLIKTNLWKIVDGKIVSNFEMLDLGDISLKDYLSMTTSLLSKLHGTKPFAYDTLSIVTNRGLIRQFVQKVNSALRDLHEESFHSTDAKPCLFAWSHTGVIEIENRRKPKQRYLNENDV